MNTLFISIIVVMNVVIAIRSFMVASEESMPDKSNKSIGDIILGIWFLVYAILVVVYASAPQLETIIYGVTPTTLCFPVMLYAFITEAIVAAIIVVFLVSISPS